SVAPLADPRGKVSGYVALAADVTESRKIERDKAVLEQSLRRTAAVSAMGALVAGVAPEVRNPIFAMTATLDAIAVVGARRPRPAAGEAGGGAAHRPRPHHPAGVAPPRLRQAAHRGDGRRAALDRAHLRGARVHAGGGKGFGDHRERGGRRALYAADAAAAAAA